MNYKSCSTIIMMSLTLGNAAHLAATPPELLFFSTLAALSGLSQCRKVLSKEQQLEPHNNIANAPIANNAPITENEKATLPTDEWFTLFISNRRGH